MSAGVSERMKGQGNQVNSTNKNVETDNRSSIPWSQQVDEAFENLSSPTEGNQSGSYDSSSGGGGTQFQYPPFNAKETGAWSGQNKSSSKRYSSTNDNYDNDGRSNNQSYSQNQQSTSYSFFSRNGDHNNTSWAAQVNSAHQQQQSNSFRRSNNYDDYYNRSERNNHQNDNFKSIQRGMQNMGLESENRSSSNNMLSKPSETNVSKTKPTTQAATVPKKMTWASVASQPAPAPRLNSTSTTSKKKGPGMPPPPMVPGKHNMDIGTWDSPKNGPILVPSPPSPVTPVPIMDPSPLSQTKSSSSNSANNNSNTNNMNNNNSSNSNINNNSNNNSNNAVLPKNEQSNSNLQNQKIRSTPSNLESNQISDNRQSNQNPRSPWVTQNNPTNTKNSSYLSQQQRPNSHYHRHQDQGNGGPIGDHQVISKGHHYRESGNDFNNFRRNNAPNPQHPPVHPPQATSPALSNASSNHPVLEELWDKNNYNPVDLDLEKASTARFFVIKSYSEDDIHRSIKYEIWCSTDHGNKRLDEAFKERENAGGIIYLFFSVNGSGHFCGMAQMMTPVDYNSVSSVWSQDKWKGKFKVKWIYVKDVPNIQLRHIRLENNENKSVTHSRDTQEVPNPEGQQVLKILHTYRHTTSIFDDFFHYEKRQEEEDSKKSEPHFPHQHHNSLGSNHPHDLPSGNRGIYRSSDYERNTGGGGGPGGFRDRNINRSSGYHNFDNRRNNDDYRSGGYQDDRMQRDKGMFRDNSGRNDVRERGVGVDGRDNRENSVEFSNNRGFHRDFNRRDDRTYGGNRDRGDNYDSNTGHSGGFMNRGTGGDNSGGGRNMGTSGGGFRENFNRDRDFHSRGGRSRGGHRN